MNESIWEEAWQKRKPPLHAAILSGTPTDYQAAMQAFVRWSIGAGRQCLLGQESSSLPSWSRRLSRKNSLIAWSWKPIRRKGLSRVPREWKARLLSAHRAALAAGFAGLDVVLDARRLPLPVADLLEKILEEFLKARSGCALCLYQLAPGVAGKKLWPLTCHPYLIVEGELCENIFCLSFLERSGSRKSDLTLSQGLRRVSRVHHRIQEWQNQRELAPEHREKSVMESKLAAIIQNLGEGVDVINPDLVIEYQNDLLAERFPNAPGRKCYQVYLRAQAPCPRCPALRAMATLQTHREKITSWDGRAYEIISSPFTDVDGKVKAIEIVRDITSRERAEEQVRESEAKYRALFEHAQEALLLENLEGKILDANPGATRLLGYSREELIGLPVDKLLPPYRRKQFPQTMERLRRQGRLQGRFECIRKDGTAIQAELDVSLIQVAGKDRFLAMVRDITERSRAETQLREAEERYRSLVENTPEAIAFGQKDQIQFVNPAFAALFGFDHPREMIGMSQLDLVAPEDQERVKAYTRQRILGKEVPSKYEFKGLHRNGAILNLAISISQFTTSGELYTQVIMRDITERKRTEAALGQSEEQFRRLTAAAPAVICRLTPAGQTLFVNEHIWRVTGYRPEELVGRNWWQVFYPGELRDQVEKLYQDFAQGDVSDYEMTLLGKDGQRRAIAWNSANLFGPDQAVREIVGVGLDVTARKQAEEEKAKLREQLFQVQKMEAIGTLAGGIAHDFNNLVGAILGYSSLLKMKLRESDPFFQPVDMIEQAGRQASELTQQLLSFARPGPHTSEPVDLNRVVERMHLLIRRTFDPAIALELRLQEGCWWVMGDAGQLEHALLNLCLHAREAMPEGGRLTLATRNLILDESSGPGRPPLRPGAYVLLTISDTGPPISASDRDRIFEPFWTPRDSDKGSGLLLALAYGIIQGHHGQIQVESQPDQGNTFQVYLPALPEKADTARAPGAADQLEPLPQGTETILVVDDDPLVRELLARKLTSLGYRPLVAANGEEACALLDQHRLKVDLVILDWIMPGSSGKDTFQRLRQRDPSLKVLLSSGYGLDGPIQEMLQAGAVGFLPKPYLIHQLAHTLRRVLG